MYSRYGLIFLSSGKLVCRFVFLLNQFSCHKVITMNVTWNQMLAICLNNYKGFNFFGKGKLEVCFYSQHLFLAAIMSFVLVIILYPWFWSCILDFYLVNVKSSNLVFLFVTQHTVQCWTLVLLVSWGFCVLYPWHEITSIIIHWTRYLFSDWPKAYGEFSKSALVTS